MLYERNTWTEFITTREIITRHTWVPFYFFDVQLYRCKRMTWNLVLEFWVTSRVEKQYNDKLWMFALGLVHKRFLFSISSKRRKDNDQKVDRIRNETLYCTWTTHSAAHFMTNIPPGSLQASKHRFMLFFFPFFSWYFFHFFSQPGPRDLLQH